MRAVSTFRSSADSVLAAAFFHCRTVQCHHAAADTVRLRFGCDDVKGFTDGVFGYGAVPTSRWPFRR